MLLSVMIKYQAEQKQNGKENFQGVNISFIKKNP
jgi:hypothetical protein